MTENENEKPNNENLSYSQEMKKAKEEGRHSVYIRQKERQIRKQAKRLNRFKAFLRMVLFFVLIFSIYCFVNLKGWYLRSDAFTSPDIQTVEIINNKIVPTSVIYNSLKEIKVQHIPIFMMSVRPIKKELYKIPVIKTLYVRRFGFPPRIKIIVRERIPMAIIKTDLKQRPAAFITTDKIMVTSKDYMHLADTNSTLCILVKSSDIKKDWNVDRVLFIEKIAKAVETYSKEKVSYVDMRNPLDVYVKIKTTSVRLGVLDSSVFDRIKRVYTILPQIHEVHEKIKYIDLSWDNVNYLKLQQKDNNKKPAPAPKKD